MPFEPGKSGNPSGAPTKEQRAAKKLSSAELKKLSKLLNKLIPQAVETVETLMLSSTAKDEVKLKAATWVVQAIVGVEKEIERRELGQKPVESDIEEEMGGTKTPSPVFSLTMQRREA